MLKRKKHTEETKKKISKSLMGHKGSHYWLGKHLSNKTKRKLSIANKGNHSSIKTEFKKGYLKSKNAHKFKKGYEHLEETKRKIGIANSGKSPSKKIREKISKKLKGRKLSDETKKRMSFAFKGRKLSKEARKKMSEARKGDKCHFWKGGITSKNEKIRNSIEFRLWRESVFARDNWTCQKTGIKGGKFTSASY